MFLPPTRLAQRGTASIEALLCFPVVMAVFVLLFDFSAAVIQKTRASVAVREVAYRHFIAAPSRRRGQADQVAQEVWPGVRDDIQRPGWRRYSFEADSAQHGFRELTGQHTSGSKNNVTVESDGGGDGGFANLANGFLAQLGGQRDFSVTIDTDYPFETILAGSASKAEIKLDASPWTRHELPCGYLDLLIMALPLPSSGKADISGWLGCSG